jgi:uncharacterized protein YaiE (UPF0345 family)
MSTFDNVSIKKEANSYFDGKVTSRTVIFSDGSQKSLGIMLPGAYEFSTVDKEIMEILSGDLIVKLPGTDTWQHFQGGDQFEVPANSAFQVKVAEMTDYCCSYIKE